MAPLAFAFGSEVASPKKSVSERKAGAKVLLFFDMTKLFAKKMRF